MFRDCLPLQSRTVTAFSGEAVAFCEGAAVFRKTMVVIRDEAVALFGDLRRFRHEAVAIGRGRVEFLVEGLTFLEEVLRDSGAMIAIRA